MTNDAGILTVIGELRRLVEARNEEIAHLREQAEAKDKKILELIALIEKDR